MTEPVSPDNPRPDQQDTGQQDSGQQDSGQQETAQQARAGDSPRVVIVGPDGMAIEGPPAAAEGEGSGEDGDQERSVTDLVEQPAKVMRVGNMIKQLLDEVKAAPLDEASRQRLREIHKSSISELEKGLAPELVEELERLSLPFDESAVPSEPELRVAQAQLVGWLEGLFHGIQTALFAQQMAARAQLEQMRSLPPGTPVPPHLAGAGAEQPAPSRDQHGGMYL